MKLKKGDLVRYSSLGNLNILKEVLIVIRTKGTLVEVLSSDSSSGWIDVAYLEKVSGT